MKIYALLLSALIGWSIADAQTRCNYRLELYDALNDGWNGASLTFIFNNRDTSVFTLESGSFRAIEVELTNGDSVAFFFTSGLFDNEVSYAIFNPEGIRIFANGPRPIAGVIFRAIIECPSCLVSLPSSVRINDVRAFTADISWQRASGARFYLLEYGLKGFRRGTGEFVRVGDNFTRLRGLLENTAYEFYLASICANADTSRFIGPYEFKTLWSNDVGVLSINTPQTKCGLSELETITVTLKNFGGNPQSLIPFKYSVNGIPGGVQIPIDGFFTGVLGKDSTFTIEFKAKFDLSEPNEYVIKAWTELEGERNRANDTATVVVVHIPIINRYPYATNFEQWGSGWTVAPNSRNASWAYGRPSGNVINSAASGRNAWVTNLSGLYNNNELSYLLSPCFDFSILREDPRISFSLNFNSEECCDRGWLEVSTDGGATWSKVGAAGSGINWYNDPVNNTWSGTGGFDGWTTASNILTGTAGKTDVRLRFVFSSDLSIAREGMGIDDVFISPPLARDLAALRVTTSARECGSTTDSLTLTISNFGSSAVSNFEASYRVNNGPIVTENVGALSIEPGGRANYTFRTPVNTANDINFNIIAWATAPGELFPANDTARVRFSTARSLPFGEDFESGRLPDGWSVDSQTSVGQGRGNRSYVVSDNLNTNDRLMEVITPSLGLVQRGDTLTFEYRITNAGTNAATQLSAGDSILVQISLDCGATYTTIFRINRNNHRPDTLLQRIAIPLDNYVGRVVKFRIRAIWGAGDYWVDFDNFFIARCPVALGLTTEVRNETASGANDGQATVEATAGVSPFSYQWSNGSTDKTAVRLGSGVYTVTVTDRFGCRETITVRVGTTTSIVEPELITRVTIAPNPTSGETWLRAELLRVSDVQVQLFSLSGQLVSQAVQQQVSTLQLPLDLSGQPSGVYLLRIIADGQIRTEKIVKMQ